MNVLVINAGSSSLKYQLMNPETGDVSAKGLCERIYIDGRLTHKVGDKKVVKDIPMPTHSEAIQAVLEILVQTPSFEPFPTALYYVHPFLRFHVVPFYPYYLLTVYTV